MLAGKRETMLWIVDTERERARCDGVRCTKQLMFHKVSIIMKGNRKDKNAHTRVEEVKKNIETNEIMCSHTHHTELD